MRIGLSGARGFLGRAIVSELALRGHQIELALTSDRKSLGKTELHWVFGQEPPELPPLDVFIHLAWDRKDNALSATSTLQLATGLSEKQPECKQLYISSISAFEGTRSDYGRWKKWLELEFAKLVKRGVILRPGLVLGDGGLSRRLQTMLKIVPVHLKIVPPLPISAVSLSEFVRATTEFSLNETLGEQAVKDSHPNNFSALLRLMGPRRMISVRVKKHFFERTLVWSAGLPLVNRVTKDTLIGLIENQKSPHIGTKETL